MNVLVLGGRVIGEAMARELVRLFVNATHSHEERHLRRLGKITAIEKAVERPGYEEKDIRV
jgi:ribose 5-phosphate isomerase RpiB